LEVELGEIHRYVNISK